MSEFSVYHLLNVTDPISPFPISYETVGEEGIEPEYPDYAPTAVESTGGGNSGALADLLREIQETRVDPETRWTAATSNGHSSIKLRDIASVLRSKNVRLFSILQPFESSEAMHRVVHMS